MSKLHIHDLRIKPNIDGKPVYTHVYIDPRAASGAIYWDGVDIRALQAEIARLQDEIKLLLHVGKEAED